MDGPKLVPRTLHTLNILMGPTHGDMHWVNNVAFSVDGKILASGSEDGNIYLWDVATGRILKTLVENGENIYSVVFSPDDKTLANGNSDNTISLWDIATGENYATLEGHTDWVFLCSVQS